MYKQLYASNSLRSCHNASMQNIKTKSLGSSDTVTLDGLTHGEMQMMIETMQKALNHGRAESFGVEIGFNTFKAFSILSCKSYRGHKVYVGEKAELTEFAS